MGRKSYGFEIKKEFVDAYHAQIETIVQATFYQQERDKQQAQRRLAYVDKEQVEMG
jgi:hypothetical protein